MVSARRRRWITSWNNNTRKIKTTNTMKQVIAIVLVAALLTACKTAQPCPSFKDQADKCHTSQKPKCCK